MFTLIRLTAVALFAWPLAVVAAQLFTGAPADTSAWLRWLGRAAGLTGFAWFLLAMVLSARLPRFDLALGGLLSLWRVHHWLGATSFLLLMLHPPLLALASVPAGPEAVLATLIPPISAWAVWSGWAALLCMMVFLAPSFSFFGAPRYQRWKLLHRFSGAALVLALVHALVLPGLLEPAAAAWVWGGIAAVAGAAFLWRLLFSRWWARRRYRITRVDAIAPRVVEITLEGPPLRYDAGQFVYFTPLDPALPVGRGEEHPYSLVSAPQEPGLRIAIKALGDASGALMNVAEGTMATVEGPYGRFLPPQQNAAALWIGGGIGIAPFVSAARALAFQSAEVDVHLVYCANDPGRAYYLAELERIAASHPGFVVHTHYFSEQGPLSASFLAGCTADFSQRVCYICGPSGLLNLAEMILTTEGVSRRHIHMEEFNLL